MTKPIMVSMSIGWPNIRSTSRSASTPPTVAIGSVSTTNSESRNERNSAEISRYRITTASRKLPAMLRRVSPSASAVPR